MRTNNYKDIDQRIYNIMEGVRHDEQFHSCLDAGCDGYHPGVKDDTQIIRKATQQIKSLLLDERIDELGNLHIWGWKSCNHDSRLATGEDKSIEARKAQLNQQKKELEQ